MSRPLYPAVEALQDLQTLLDLKDMAGLVGAWRRSSRMRRGLGRRAERSGLTYGESEGCGRDVKIVNDIAQKEGNVSAHPDVEHKYKGTVGETEAENA